MGQDLKNDLGAMRYLHDMSPNLKYELFDNKMLKEAYSITLDKIPAVKGNRAWTEREYSAMQVFR